MDVDTTAEAFLRLAEELGAVAWMVRARHSAYVSLRIGGDEVVVRVSDHATVSHRHPPCAFNVAPGRDSEAVVRAALVRRWMEA